MAATTATVKGITGVGGAVDVSIKAFEHIKVVIEGSGELGEQVERVHLICIQVDYHLRRLREGNLPDSIRDIKGALDAVSEFATTYKNNVTSLARVKGMPKVLSKIEKLDAVETGMKTVLAMVTTQVTAERNTNMKELTEKLGKLKSQLVENTAELTELNKTIASEFDALRARLSVMNERLMEIGVKVDAQEGVKDLLEELKGPLKESVASGETSEVFNQVQFDQGTELTRGEFNQGNAYGSGTAPSSGERWRNDMSFRGAKATGVIFNQGNRYGSDWNGTRKM